MNKMIDRFVKQRTKRLVDHDIIIIETFINESVSEDEHKN